MKNLKKLNRQNQIRIHGGGPRKCLDENQCNLGECCSGGSCIRSPCPICDPLLE